VLVHTKHGRNRVRRRSVRLISRFAAASRTLSSPCPLKQPACRGRSNVFRRRRSGRSGTASTWSTSHIEARATIGPASARLPSGGSTPSRIRRPCSGRSAWRWIRTPPSRSTSSATARCEPTSRLSGTASGSNVTPVPRIPARCPAVFRRADVFVLPSLSEGIPITLLEAMATGLPSIATGVGGNAEVVVHGETGYWCPPPLRR